ncbi:hypothetical protein FisN_2Lh365 [Fistulifera solaris]|uniref:Uncharacterized protein n=1 Tax=Fistulifera solaris TaxID=1519565 RepID=A0A1Z5JPL1_FISSO|nr:hypothetical protein FisN_2Lh365 [Fistulifera solaris]|eukprot:GAX15899.1 hypothetical protein FisN_2Lh365 [Fistulifera solaris]
MKQDSLPRRPRRAHSPERLCINKTTSFKAVIRRVSFADSVSDLSLSSSQESGCESVCSFCSFDDLSTILNHSTATPTSSSLSSSSSSRKFSTTTRLSLFSSQAHEKKKSKSKTKTGRGGRKQPKQEQEILNRWDSWKNDEPQGSPVKPERKALVDSRWSSHSSRAPMSSPRRSSSPHRISCPPSPLASPPLMPLEPPQQDIVFHPQSSAKQLPTLPQLHPRAVLTRRPKARNLVLEAAVSPNRFPRHKAILTERDHETIRKLKSTWESRRSVATTSTRDSAASSTASPDYSIPWFSSSLQRPSALK